MADPAQIERIVASLTEAQQRAVLTDWRGFHADHHGKWWSRTARIQHALYELGLIETDACLAYPTQLGLQVRHHLAEQSKQGGGDAS